MNTPIRRVAIGILLLFGILFVNLNVIQMLRAEELRGDPRNPRELIRTYSRQRGPIVVGGSSVAESVPTEDTYKYLRVYPGGQVFAPATGFYSLNYGASAIERTEDKFLAGTADELFGRRLSDLVTGREPEGGTVVLTLNQDAQEAAFAGLNGRRGGVVALNPSTGAVLAMATSPSYDPTTISTHNTQANKVAYDALNSDAAKPLLNRAIAQTYPPGSTFKVVVAAAALESGQYTPQSVIPAPPTYTPPGTTKAISNAGEEICSSSGQTTLADALRTSCNTAFASLGVSLGDDAIRAQAEKFGFNNSFEIPLLAAESVYPEDLDAAQTAQSALGQFDVRATALQMAMVAAGVGNRGRVMAPFLVDRLQAPDFEVLSQTRPREFSEAVSATVATQLTEMMVSAVENGTGGAAQIPGVTVAGKTGTAQNAPGRPDHAWFISFAPADAPTVAVGVVVENSGFGGQVAAPIARSVMEAVLSSEP